MILPFHAYCSKQEILAEGKFQDTLDWIKRKFTALFSRLSFGETETVHIPMPLSEAVVAGATNTAAVKAFVGYYAEAITAKVLAEQIKKAGGQLGENSKPSDFQQEINARLQKVKQANTPQNEILRAETGGQALGEAIWNDIQETATDFAFLTFTIMLSGISEKGKGKSDLIVRVTKDKNKEALLTIGASLKVYKTAQINLANSSFISLIKKLFYDSDHPIQERGVTTEEFITQFIADYGQSAGSLLKKLSSLQNYISQQMGMGKTKSQARKGAKLTHPEVINIILKIFNDNYKGTRKELINARFLKLVGFDGVDDFYAAIGEKGIPRVLSSRNSPEFQTLLEAFRSSFTINFEYKPNTTFIDVLILGQDDIPLLEGSVTFADSGGKAAAGKTNFFISFKPLLP